MSEPGQIPLDSMGEKEPVLSAVDNPTPASVEGSPAIQPVQPPANETTDLGPGKVAESETAPGQPAVLPNPNSPEGDPGSLSPENPDQTESQQRLQQSEQKIAEIIAINYAQALADQFDHLDEAVVASLPGVSPEEKKANYIKTQSEQWAQLIMNGDRGISEVLPGLMKRKGELQLDGKGSPTLDAQDQPKIEFTPEKRDEVWAEFLKEHELDPGKKMADLDQDLELKAKFEEFVTNAIADDQKKEAFRYKLYRIGVVPFGRYVRGSVDDSDFGEFVDFLISGGSRYGGGSRTETGENVGSEVAVSTFYDWLSDRNDSGPEKMKKLGRFTHGVWEVLRHEHKELNLGDLPSLSEPPTTEAFQSMMKQFMDTIEKYIATEGRLDLAKFNQLAYLADGGSDQVEERVLNGHLKEEFNSGKGKVLGKDVMIHLGRIAHSASFVGRFFELNDAESAPDTTSTAPTPQTPVAQAA
jgi:hypothetical protein